MDEQPSTVPKIYGAIAAIMKETKAITKSSRNQQQGFMFRGIDAVMNELHDLFANNGVFILPEVLYYTRAKIKFHFVADDGSEAIAINVGEAMDSGDKGMNKAMSIALKYALMQMLLIPTEEQKDPDATTPPETRPKTINEIIQSLDSVKEAELVAALTSIVGVSDRDALMNVWNSNSALHQNPTFTQCMSTKKKELGL